MEHAASVRAAAAGVSSITYRLCAAVSGQADMAKGRTKGQFVFGKDGARQRAAGSAAFDMLLALYGSCKAVSSKDVCVLCFYLRKCGVRGGQWGRFAMAPDKQTGKYKQLMDRHLPGPGPLYTAKLPATVRRNAHVRSRSIVFREVFRTVSDEVSSSPDTQAVLADGPCDDPTSVLSVPCYREHPLVRQCVDDTGKWPLPLALYIDGVRYTPICAGRSDYAASRGTLGGGHHHFYSISTSINVE